MPDKKQVRAAAAALEASLLKSASLARENLEHNRRDIIQLRREISQRMADLLATGLAISDEGFNAPFRAEFSRMRSAMAFHQASWPVVAIDPSNAKYIESIEANRQAYRRFFEWLRTNAAD